MKNLVKTAAIASLMAFSPAIVPTAFSAEPIVGTWKRSNGTLIKYSGSGPRYCGMVMNGKYKGQSIGCLSGSGGSYKGKVNVLDEGKTYSGKGKVTGNSFKLSGCVFGGVICKSETLMRQ